ncbi:MAG: bile acid:sodium symporter family protein [Acidimicrobiia bacterium]|nr:bile acid:sodium symporter family protein [Acidimicrobiia bacterium]
MSETLIEIANVSILTFVLTSMVALGLSLTVTQILTPLRNGRLIALALVVNFVVAPLAAWGAARIFGLDDAMTLGLLLLGTAAGAPFLPKLAQLAKADVAYSVGLMVLLMVVTVGYIPLVLVRLVDGVDVSAWDIAKPLVVGMLLPLTLALAVRARYTDAAKLAPTLNTVSTATLAIALIIGIGIGLPSLWDSIGTGAFIAMLVFMGVCLGSGYLLGGSTTAERWVTSFGTTQRNVSAALLIATTSFAGQAEVLIIVLVGAVLMAAVLLPLAAEIGKSRTR